MKVHNRGILITGASRGLGRALAFELAARGARLALCAREREPLERTAREIAATGAVAHAIVADIGDKLAIHPLAAQAQALVGPVDIVINNASTLGPVPMPLLVDTECEDFQQVLDVNLLGPFRLIKTLAVPMALRGDGLVLNISSDAAVEAYQGWGAYGVSKAALDHLTRVWAAELAGSGVRWLSIDPGEMDTQMHKDALPEADPATLTSPAEVARRIVRLIEELGAPPGPRELRRVAEARA